MVLNYIEHLFVLVSVTTGWILIFAFAMFVGIPIVIASSERKKQNEIVLLAKGKLSTVKVLFSKDVIDSYQSWWVFSREKFLGRLWW